MTENPTPPTPPPDAGMAATIQALQQQASQAGTLATQGMLNIILDNIRNAAFQIGHQSGAKSRDAEVVDLSTRLNQQGASLETAKRELAKRELAEARAETELAESLAQRRLAVIEGFCAILAEDGLSTYDAIRFGCAKAIGALAGADLLPADIPVDTPTSDLLAEVAMLAGGSGTGLSGTIVLNGAVRTGSDAMATAKEEKASNDG